MTGVVKELWSQQLLKEQGLLYVKLAIFSTKFQNTYFFFYNWWFKLWHIGKSEVALSCLTLCDPVDCSPPAPLSMRFSRQEYWSGLSFFFSRGSSWPRSRTQVSHIVGRRFNLWTTRKPWHIGVSYYSGGIVLLCFGVPRAILTLKDYLEWFVRAWNSFVQWFITQL